MFRVDERRLFDRREWFATVLGNHFPGKVSVFDGRVAKNRRPDSGPTGPDWLRLAPIGPDSPDWLRLFGAGSAARNLPSTRTGGQDDVSLNKLPQNITYLDL